MDHYYAILNKITNEKNNYFFDVKPFTIKIIFFFESKTTIHLLYLQNYSPTNSHNFTHFEFKVLNPLSSLVSTRLPKSKI